jgi:methyl-accepting chemotaxis protein
MTEYTTDADLIRDALNKHGSLSRSDLVEKTNLERAVIAKPLYSLKKQGDVIEEGDLLTLTKAAEMAQDAPEEAETGIGSTPAVESGTDAVSKTQAVMQKMLDKMPRQDTRPNSPDELPELASSSLNALIADYHRVIDEWRLMKLQVEDNKSLWEDMQQLRETNNRLLADSLAYIALKEKLRGMIDAD